MAGLGLVGAGGAVGAEDALKQMIVERLKAEATQRQADQQQFDNSIKTRQITSLEADQAAQAQERLANATKPGRLVTVNQGGKPILTPETQAVGQEEWQKPATPSGRLITTSQNGKPILTPEDQAAGMTPYEKPTREPDPQPQLLLDAQGNTHAYQFHNGVAKEIPLPSGLSKTAPPKQNIPGTTQDALAGINVAEVEGVKVLRALKDSGLDKSNNPLDPRWQKFMVTTLKMAPEDFRKADIQQRTAMVNAVLTRGLMGGRPSQYVAEMVQQHMPQGEMSGQQLTHVLTNVLQQANERRQETAHLFGRKVEEIGPTSGETYNQFLQSSAPQAPAGWKYVPKPGGGWTAVEAK